MKKPSEILLHVPPFVGTLKKAQFEFAALLIVRTCQVNGDVWQAVGPGDIGKVWTDDVATKTKPLCSLDRNPFFRPDLRGLVGAGFARFVGEVDPKPIELTDEAIERIANGPQQPKPPVDP